MNQSRNTPAADSYVVVQEGGSSVELYLHAHESEEEAQADREDCSSDGAYRTSPVVKVPGSLAAYGELFYETIEALLGGVVSINFPHWYNDGDFKSAPGDAFVVVQVDGARDEYLLHAFDSRQVAEAWCSSHAEVAYSLSRIVPIPAALYAEGALFSEVAREILCATLQFECVDVPEAEAKGSLKP